MLMVSGVGVCGVTLTRSNRSGHVDASQQRFQIPVYLSSVGGPMVACVNMIEKHVDVWTDGEGRVGFG